MNHPGPRAKRRLNSNASQAWFRKAAVASLVLSFAITAAAAELVSARDGGIVLPAGGNGDSVAPVISPDGRFVLFASDANNLVPGGNGQPGLNVFVRDRSSNATVLVSANPNGSGQGNGASWPGQISTNGQYVVYQSDATDLVANDTNKLSDVFVRNLAAGTNQLVSVALGGAAGNGKSSEPVMTPDGRFVAFVSAAYNLVSNDMNAMPDVFVRDLVSGLTIQASVGASIPAGRSTANVSAPVITPDGRYVAFLSDAVGLAGGVPSSPPSEVYVRDLVANITTWASVDAAALVWTNLGLSSAPSYHARISDDGRYVAFKCGRTNSAGAAVVLQYDVLADATSVVSTNGVGWFANADDDYGPEMTPGGEYVAFVQHEGAFGSDCCSVHVWDSWTGSDTLVSDPGAGGMITTVSRRPVLSADSWCVAFLSNASNLVYNPVSSGYHIYLRNFLQGSLQLVDADTNGAGSTDNELASYSLSAHGRYVAYSSPDGSLVGLDQNHASDVFVQDLFWETAELISTRDMSVIPQSPDNVSVLTSDAVSADGRWVTFASAADDLVPNDTNGLPDIFVRDLATGSIALVTVGSDGAAAAGGGSAGPIINADGRYVLFLSSATNLVAGIINTTLNVFQRDLLTQVTTLVSVDTNGAGPANGDCSDPVMSQDGRYVAFLSMAWNLAPASPPILPGNKNRHTYWRDLIAGSTLHLTNQLEATYGPAMSQDGRYVAYCYSNAFVRSLRVFDVQTGSHLYTNSAAITAVVLSPDGQRVAGRNAAGIVVVDHVAARTNCFGFNSPGSWSAIGWGAGGRFLAYVAATNVSGTNLYVRDCETGTEQLIAPACAPVGSLSGFADAPVVSADGRFVAYRSSVAGIVPGSTNVPNLYLFDRVTGTNSLLTQGQAGSSPLVWHSKPAMSRNGSTIAFLSLGGDLVAGDLNRVPDTFAFELEPPLSPADTDGDGIPDWWTTLYFGHPTGQAGDLSRAQDDADGDGELNLEEYWTGAVPTDPASVFRIQISSVVQSGIVTLSWPAVPGKRYRVQRQNALGGPGWSDVPGFVWSDGTRGYCLVTASQDTVFYRVSQNE